MTKIVTGDALRELRKLPAASFAGCLCDPPYGLKFMGKSWDHGVPGADVWREVLRCLKPGSWLLAFGGSRTHHRLMCAIEDAGFEIRDCMMWLYGSGFPKAKSCLKPAWEPIVLARKRGRVLPLNVDASRIATADKWSSPTSAFTATRLFSAERNSEQFTKTTHDAGRWPANVILDDEAAAALDEQSGTLTSGNNPARRHSPKTGNIYGLGFGDQCLAHRKTDAGGASRFFYCAKASTRERGDGNTHPTVKPLKLTEYLARLILPADPAARLLVPYSGSGSEMLGARRAGWRHITGIERDAAYTAIASKRMAA